MTRRSVLDFRPSYLRYAGEVAAVVSCVLSSGALLQGAWVRRCEDQLAGLTGKRHALLFSSATTAIESVMSYGAGEVVTPTINFVSVPYTARKLGRGVRLLPRTRPLSGPMDHHGQPPGEGQQWHVALAGQAGDDYVRSVGPADIEDASQCFMTMTPAGMVGTFGLAGIYSFTFNKFATSGEGGCVVTDDDDLHEFLYRQRDFGRSPAAGLAGRPVDHVGYNYRVAEVNAAMLSVQLDHAEETRDHFRGLHERYAAELRLAGLAPVTDDHDNYTRVVVRVPAVAQTRQWLAARYGISTPTPIMDYSMAESSGFAGRAEEGWDELLCLPFWYGLTHDDIRYVADSLARVLSASMAPGTP
jgi:dTDP-4-amino-4,6-dideoxygalactose transaminase